MRKVKWIFFAYLAMVALIIASLAYSFTVVPPRDPHTLYTALYYNIRSLDPPKITDVPTSVVAGHVYECLFNYDYEKRPFTLIPELADGMSQLSEDGKTFTVRIKKGIHYFDPNDQIPGWEPVKDAGGKV